jgi:hypothetical protein
MMNNKGLFDDEQRMVARDQMISEDDPGAGDGERRSFVHERAILGDEKESLFVDECARMKNK